MRRATCRARVIGPSHTSQFPADPAFDRARSRGFELVTAPDAKAYAPVMSCQLRFVPYVGGARDLAGMEQLVSQKGNEVVAGAM